MMNKPQTRRQRNQELGRIDFEHRCAVCKRAFTETGQIVEDLIFPGRYCSDACLETAQQRAEHDA